MRIPELDLECDVLECVRVVDRELEIVSQTFLKEVETRVGRQIVSASVFVDDPDIIVFESPETPGLDNFENLFHYHVKLGEDESAQLMLLLY